MRTSSYVVFADDAKRGKTVLLQGMAGMIDRVDRRVADFLRQGSFDQAARARYGISQATLHWLERRRYLTRLAPQDEQRLFVEQAADLHQINQRSIAPSFSFIPSYRCNLRCFYCFQDHELHRQRGLMSRQTADAAFSAIDGFLFESEISHRGIEVKLWGGEPLLAENRPVIQYIVDRCREVGFRVRAVTNGTDLGAYRDLIGRSGISQLQITLDGPRRIHDRRRTDDPRNPNFDTIVANIEDALERGVHVDLRMNVDRSNASSVPQLDSFVRRRRWHERPQFSFRIAHLTPSPGFHPRTLLQGSDVLPILNGEDQGESNCSVVCHPMGRIERAVARALKTGRMPLTSTVFCTAMLSYFILDLNGDVYACENEAGQQEKRVGRFADGCLRLNESHEQVWRRRTVANIPECSHCAAALLCGGGCAYNAHQAKGRYFSSYCDGFFKSLEQTLPAAFEKHGAGVCEPPHGT